MVLGEVKNMVLGKIKNMVLGEVKNMALGEVLNMVLGEVKNMVLGEAQIISCICQSFPSLIFSLHYFILFPVRVRILPALNFILALLENI